MSSNHYLKIVQKWATFERLACVGFGRPYDGKSLSSVKNTQPCGECKHELMAREPGLSAAALVFVQYRDSKCLKFDEHPEESFTGHALQRI